MPSTRENKGFGKARIREPPPHRRDGDLIRSRVDRSLSIRDFDRGA
jgi:hypothetical protein